MQSDLFTGDDADCQTSSTSYIMIKYLKEKTLMVNMINMKPVFTQVISRLVLPYIGDEVYPFWNTAAKNLQRWPQSFEKQGGDWTKRWK